MSTEIPLFQIDAFVTSRPFSGNPAAVCPLDRWLPDGLLQGIALENNLSETAFLVPAGPEGVYDLRWFTPEVEVDLCGHATLAAAYAVFEFMRPDLRKVWFKTKNSGTLTVTRGAGEILSMDFPAIVPQACPRNPAIVDALGVEPSELFAATNYMAVYGDAGFVATVTPDFGVLAKLDRQGLIVTAAGGDGDFVSRYFAPGAGVPEDPVTGSAHCMLAPYWAQKLGRPHLDGRQLSKRGGQVHCAVEGERVILTGKARRYLSGALLLE